METEDGLTHERPEQAQEKTLDRSAGETYNPNSTDVVDEHRTRFDAVNRELQQNREQVRATWNRKNERFLEEAHQAAENPEHQAMQAHQNDHMLQSPAAQPAGQEEIVPDETSTGSTHDDPNMRPAEHPGSPVDPDRFMGPPIL